MLGCSRWFSRFVIAAMLVDENKRFLISSFYSSTSNCRLQHCYVSLEIDCKPPIDCIYFYVFFVYVCIQAPRVSVFYVVHSASWDRKWAPKVLALISLSPLREHWYYLVLSLIIRVKKDKIKRENNPIRLPLETWCSLSVPQCTASNRGNWNSCCLYWLGQT